MTCTGMDMRLSPTRGKLILHGISFETGFMKTALVKTDFKRACVCVNERGPLFRRACPGARLRGWLGGLSLTACPKSRKIHKINTARSLKPD